MDSKWLKEKDTLIDLIINQKKSYEEIGRSYNCTGGNIKKVAKTLNIELPQRRKINSKEHFNKSKFTNKCAYCGKSIPNSKKYCNQTCMGKHKHEINYNKFLNGNSELMRANYTPRLFRNDILKEQGNKCAICGMEPIWNGKPITFILDHIDGHASNNTRSNIRCICPNCDSQLDTYKSKNKNGERSYYRYHKNSNIVQSEIDPSL